jgi:tRNA-Thr(GGU) m(6)t(6)A37 methyltransferase TsaA
MQSVTYKPIGIIHTPFKNLSDAPIQPSAGRGEAGRVELFPQYAEGLQDLDRFSHIILIYHFHLSGTYSLRVKPFLDDQMRGLFATRAPARPNRIGHSVVRLQAIESNILSVQNVDMLNGTPLLDIKPYVPEFDRHEPVKTGWLQDRIGTLPGKRGDTRFG